jgi:hypothetical protein
MRRRLLSAILLSSVLSLTGCFDNVETEFPAGLEPWETPNEAPDPEAVDGDPYPEEIVFLHERWMRASSVHARAYVHADVATTFAAVHDPLSGADRRPQVTFTYEEDVDPDYRWSHRSHLIVPDIVTVEFELTWRSGLVEGTEEMPTITATRWQKTWGTTAITLLEGSVVCQRVSDDVTELQIQYHLNAVGSGYDTIENYLRGYFDSIVALAHDEPLPPQM